MLQWDRNLRMPGRLQTLTVVVVVVVIVIGFMSMSPQLFAALPSPHSISIA